MVTTIAFSDLDNWLQSQIGNTPETAYELEITGLTINDVGSSRVNGTLGNILKNTNNIYVDLSETELPSELTNLNIAFENCTTLIKAPIIPSGVTSLRYTFYGCRALSKAPIIPSGVTDLEDTFAECLALTESPVIPYGVTNMTYTFYYCVKLKCAPLIPNSVVYLSSTFRNCTALEEVPNIPASVTDASQCFLDCTSLKRINEFAILVTTLDNYHFQNMFANCSSLEQIGKEPENASDWNLWYLKFNSNTVQGKIYSRDKTSVTISQTTITKDTLTLPILTDELLFNTSISASDLENIIEGYTDTEYHKGMLDTNYSWFGKQVIEPTGDHFVMYAKDKDKFISNISFGGFQIKRLKDADCSATGTTYSLDSGESFLDWDFIIPIVTLYDSEQQQTQFIPKIEIEWQIGHSNTDSAFMQCGSTSGTDRRLAWCPKSESTFKVGMRNGTSGHLPHLWGFYGVKFG